MLVCHVRPTLNEGKGWLVIHCSSSFQLCAMPLRNVETYLISCQMLRRRGIVPRTDVFVVGKGVLCN